MQPERFDAIVIGGGQAGSATGYHLAQRGLSFVILESADPVGDSWRRRWEGLRLFTAAQYDGLPGVRFPAPPHSFPTKDEVADFLESYAEGMALPLRTGVRVDALRSSHDGDRYVVLAEEQPLEAPAIVVATGAYLKGRVPAFAAELDPPIRQYHSVDYRSPGRPEAGPVLVVGASNSGAEVAHGAARDHQTTLIGPDTGQMPFPIDSRRAQVFDRVFWYFINHFVTLRTPIGRRALSAVRDHGGPLERVRSADLAAAGVARIVGRVVGTRRGRPLLTTVGSSRCRTSSGALGIGPTSAGSRFRWPMPRVGRARSEASRPMRLGCTPSGCRSCTQRHRRCSGELVATRPTSPHRWRSEFAQSGRRSGGRQPRIRWTGRWSQPSRREAPDPSPIQAPSRDVAGGCAAHRTW